MTRKRTALTGSLDISLQPKQKVAWDYINGGQYTWIGLGGSKGGGKLAPLDSYVSTPKGPVRNGDLVIGQQVTDPSTGGATRVVQIFDHPPMPIWKFTFDDGATLSVGEDHLWAFYITGHLRPGRKASSERAFAVDELGAWQPDGEWFNFRVGPTSEILGLLGEGKKIRIPLTQPVVYTLDFHHERVHPSPYLMGLFLGDGHLATATITTADKEIIELLTGLGYGTSTKAGSAAVSMRARGGHGAQVRRAFREDGISECRSWEKFIPDRFKCASLEDRLELLRGLMDTDGYVDERGRCYYTSVSERLARDVMGLVRSLGGKCSVRAKKTRYEYKGEKLAGRTAYQLRIWMKKTSTIFKLPRKIERCRDDWNGGRGVLTRQLISVTREHDQAARCITVSSPFGLYVAGDSPDDFIVTHNSGGARRILLPLLFAHPGTAALLVRKTYKEVVMNHVEKIILEFPQLAQFYNKSDQMFRSPLAKGMTSRLYIGYGENEGDVRRYNGTDDFAWVFVDQAEEFPEGDINTLRTCLRSTIPNVNPAMILSFNPGGLSHQFLKRIFKDRKFKEGIENPDQYAPMIEARGWDNVEWVRTELERDGFTVDGYYYEWDEEKRREYFLQSAYGKNLLANPDKTLREWYLWGNWDTYAGQYFDQFDRDVHTYIPGMVTIEPEWYRWISCDIGFQHKAVIQWHAYDGEVIYTYREFAQARMEAKDLADVIVEKSKDETIGAFYLSHDAFGKRDSVKTRAMEIAEVMLQNGLPTPVSPDLDRVGGWRLMNYLLVSGGWKISRDCVDLIQTIPGAVRNPRDPEDVLKFDGDDPLDTARYGLKTYQRSPRGNREKLIEAAVKSSDPTIQYLQRAMAEAKLKNGFTRPISLAARPRQQRAWRWAAGGVR